MIPRHIYTFWEPKGSIPAYLRLCMQTWKTNAPDFEITVLDHNDIMPFLNRAELPADSILQLPLQIQKDAIQAAVLLNDGGIFMDVDMIILNTLQPVFEFLEQSEAVLFSNHLAFIAARPGAAVIKQWTKGIRQILTDVNPESLAQAPWDFVGNSITNSLFKSSPISQVLQLDKHKYAFTPETIHFCNKGGPGEQYRKFWFDSHEPDTPFYRNQFLIALHNSWTPDWYRKLNEDDVLKEKCLMSVTLKNVLSGNHHAFKKNRVGLIHRAGMLYYTFKK